VSHSEEARSAERHRSYIASVGRSVLSKGFAFARSLLVLPLITPAEFGLFRYIMVFVGYLSHLHLGVLHYLGFAYPAQKGAGADAEADAMIAISRRVSMVGGVAAAATFFAFSITTDLSWHLVASASVLLAFALPADYVTVLLKVREQFRLLARRDFWADFLSTLAILGLTWRFGLPGLLLGALARSPILVLFSSKDLLAPLPPAGSGAFVATLKRGLPVAAATLLTDFVNTFDLVLLTFFVGEGNPMVGFFAFAVMVMTHLDGITAPISQIELIQLSRRRGELGDAAALVPDIGTALSRDCLLSLVLMCLGAAGASAILFFLPAYQPALPAVAMLLPAAAIRRWRKYGTYLLSLFERLRWLKVCCVLTLAVLAGGYVAIHEFFDDSLVAYALWSNVTAFVFGASLLGSALVCIANAATATRLLARLSLAHMPLGALLFVPLLPQPMLSLPAAALVTLLGARVIFGWLFPEAVREAKTLLRGLLSGSRKGASSL
jgi:hypothetical protein